MSKNVVSAILWLVYTTCMIAFLVGNALGNAGRIPEKPNEPISQYLWIMVLVILFCLSAGAFISGYQFGKEAKQ